MKIRIIVLLLFFGLSLQVNAQEKSYAKKAQNQRTAGYILLASGVTMITIALASDLSSDSPSLLVSGGLSTLASIPFFVSASKNKKRAGNISALMEVQQFKAYVNSPPGDMIPALKLRISL